MIKVEDMTAEGFAKAYAALDKFKAEAEKAGVDFKTSAGGMEKAAIGVGESCDIASHKMVEHGKEVRAATKEYKLANIEAMQYNQILQMTGTTVVQWGTKMQGGHNLVNKAITEFTEKMDEATGGAMSYFGAGVQVAGMLIEGYAQMSRMILMWGMHTAAVAADTTATGLQTAATAGLIPIQAALNAVMMANPAVLLALAIVGVVAAIGVAVVAFNNYKESQVQAIKQNQALIDSIDKTKTKLRSLYEGETKDVQDLMAKRDDLQKQMEMAQLRQKAAEEMGLTDEAAAAREKADALYQEKTLVEREIELAKGQSSNLQDVLAAHDKMASQVAEAYAKKWSGGKFWLTPMEPEIEKGAHDFGQRYADAWAQGVRDGAYSPENQAIIDDAVEKLGEDFESHSPPRAGPLKEIDKWGKNAMVAFGGGMVAGVPEIERTLSHELKMSVAAQLGGMARETGTSYSYSTESRTTSPTIHFHINSQNEEWIMERIMNALEEIFK